MRILSKCASPPVTRARSLVQKQQPKRTLTTVQPQVRSHFPAGAWLADCPGASLKETLCLSRCTEVTSLPLSWNPWTMWTALWQNRKTVGEQSATSSELAFEGILHVVAAADRHVLSRCGVTKMTNPWKNSMAMLSHRIPPSQALFSEDHRKVWGNICHCRFCPSLRWRVLQCQKVAITQSVAPWSPRNGNGGEVAGSMLACVRQPEWKMTRLEEKKRTKLLGFSASLLDVHTVWNRRWP